MFRNKRRTSLDNHCSSSEAPIVVSCLTPYVPPKTTAREQMYANRYKELSAEFRTASQTRQNPATLTNNFSPTKCDSRLNKKSIVFEEYEDQKQCLYVRPKGLLQVDPNRFQITPSELTMLRGKHHVALTQVDVSTATGEVKRLKTPAACQFDSYMNPSLSVTIPSAQGAANNSNHGTPSRHPRSPHEFDDHMSSCSSLGSQRSSKKGYVIPLPHGTVYNKTC
mmetsp:Transcript_25716/g.43326  ORF Transcript_25716/g.43326 Transcript_25716/m.43326 type:complete len:223 (+) Transcript_25716:134-802(+)